MAEISVQTAMRITSIAVYGYDFIVTIPSEFRLYRRQQFWYKPSIPCILFGLARYFGLFYIIWVTYVYFHSGWTAEGCNRISVVGALFRGFVSSIAAVTLMWRTWAIWQKNRVILVILVITLIPVTFFSYVQGLSGQTPVVTAEGGCTAVSKGNGPLSAKWTYALGNMLYDTLTCVLSTIPLARNIRKGNSPISSILLADGIGYFVVSIVIQMANLIFLLNPDKSKQGTFLTLQTALTTILVQKLITALSERTSIIPSSVHESSVRERSGSRSRSRVASKFSSIVAKPPVPASWSIHNPVQSAITSKTSRSDLEMVKIDVEVEQVVHSDGGREERKVVYFDERDH
ncbi:hypothetical protein DL96DRAFT_1678239 [Flagelloscypha sp. PMI_526]|nr:hypothetical protein DL96DRAFT_1678239 [Flagelloscypha sp. PMI_526]